MLNKHNKCEAIFGINDDGKVFGVNIGKKTLPDISNELRNNLKPLPTKIDITEEKNGEFTTIRVYVEGEDTSYSAYGRYYVRVDDGDIPMTNTQLQYYFDSKKDNYSKWEKKILIHLLMI